MPWSARVRRGILLPIATTVLAFFVGGLVVALTGHDPFSAYRAIFDGTGLTYIFPWTPPADKEFAALNLQQTLIITAPLILLRAGGGVPLPLRHVQHRRPGPVHGGDRRRDLGRHPLRRTWQAACTSPWRCVGAALRGALWGGDRRRA